MTSKWQPETLGQYHVMWTALLVKAPDRFYNILDMSPVADQKAALVEEFGRLRAGFHFARKRLKDERVSRIAEELITMSLEAYLAGDKKTGAHTLQECEGLIWPSYQMRVKYGVEAERRAFGENTLYADVIISPYPYEGTAADLGADQAALLELAERWFKSYHAQHRDFKYFSWVMDAEGVVRRTSADPKEDDHPLLKPLQKSWGYKRLKALGEAGQVRACVLMQQSYGLVIYDLEQQGRPRVSATQLYKRNGDHMHYEKMRFHLEDPQFLDGG